MSERVVYLNGSVVPEGEAKVSVFDRGFTSGDAVYEVTRSFAHKLFRLDRHVDRLRRSLAYTRIDCGLSADQLQQLSEDVFERNRHLLGEYDDYLLWNIISRGERPPSPNRHATVVTYCAPVLSANFARTYLDGVTVITPATRRIPPQSLDSRAKIANKMNHMMAKFEAQQAGPDAVPLMLDIDGNITETDLANFFFVAGGKLCTPLARNVLGGITREAVIELADRLGIEVAEGVYTPYDVYMADEAFTTGTSETISPVRSFNGSPIGAELPGPVTLNLIKAWNDLVGVDIVARAIMNLGDNERADLMVEWDKRCATLEA